MGENELLLRHAEAWATTTNRPLDRDLVATALGLWASQEGRSAQEWPEGSVARLLLQHWPSQEPIEEAGIQVLVDSLETFWRFLRATGRMRSGSAEPRTLVKEARRAAPKMTKVCTGPARNARMTVEEALSGWGEALDEQDDFDGDQEDDYFEEDYPLDETWALLPNHFDGWAPDPSVEVSAREARQSPFIQECLRFARWIGEGKRVTSGVLRPAQVQEATVEFRLQAWEREFLSRSPLTGPDIQDSPTLRDRAPDGHLGELDHHVATRALQSLWSACESAGLIEVGSTTVSATAAAHPRHTRSPDDWAQLGHDAIAEAVITRHFLEPLDPVLRVLFPFLHEGVDRVEVDDVRDWWWEHDANPWARLDLGISQARTSSDRQVNRLLWALDDTGIWRREGETLHRTALGADVAMQFMSDLSGLLAAV